MIQEKRLTFWSINLPVIATGLAILMRFMSDIGYDFETIRYTFVIIFSLLLISFYFHFQLLSLEIFRIIKRLKEKSKKSIKELGEKITETKQYFFCEKNISYQLVKAEIPIVNIHQDSYQIAQYPKIEIIKKQAELTKKQKQAIDYIKVKLENYIVESEDVELLCNYIIAYSNGKTDFSNHTPVKVKNLSNLDLYHFGWNIWKHFKVGKQDEIAIFLKSIFRENLADVDVKSIKSHLKDDEKIGIIKIKEDLSKLDDE